MRSSFMVAMVMSVSLGFAQETPFDWQTLGETTYAPCASCHATQGTGLAGAVPPHVGHLPYIVAKAGGRQYLINVLLYGLKGDIRVFGESYSGVMPIWSSLSDLEIAAVLNYELHTWGNDALLPEGFVPIEPAEVAAERGKDWDAAAVLELRHTLELSGDE